MDALQVTLYTKADCHLCDELKADLATLAWNLDVREVDIEEDAQTYQRFRHLIPVLEIEGYPLLYPPHDRHTLTQALARAAAGTTWGEHP